MNKIIFKRFGKYLNHACWQDLIPHTPNTYTRRLKEHWAHLQPLSHSWFLQRYWYLSSDSTTRALSWWQMPSCPAGTRVVTVPSFAYYFTKKKEKKKKPDRNRCIHTMQMREGNPLRSLPSKQMHKLLPHWNHRRGVRSWMLSHRGPAGRGGPDSPVSSKLLIGKEHQAPRGPRVLSHRGAVNRSGRRWREEETGKPVSSWRCLSERPQACQGWRENERHLLRLPEPELY